jgi:hypothetical protein
MHDSATLDHLARQAQQALASGQAELAQEPIAKLAAAAPGHQTVLLLKQWAAVIGFPWPLERVPYTPAVRPAPEQSRLELVAFHANMNSAPSGLHNPFDYLAVLKLSFESAALRAPQAKRVLLTDEHTPIPDGMQVDEVKRYPLDLTKLMYERMRVQELYLEQRSPDVYTVFMDSDVVVNRDPAPIFGANFDVGLTWRPEFIDAPFNGGMIFVNAGEGGLAFFRQARACYDALADSPAVAPLYGKPLRGWWGDQFALALVAGYKEYFQRRTEGVTAGGVNVRYFPCADYNFTLEGNVNYTPQFLAAKYFVHFKGNRKSMQAQYLAAMREGRL